MNRDWSPRQSGCLDAISRQQIEKSLQRVIGMPDSPERDWSAAGGALHGADLLLLVVVLFLFTPIVFVFIFVFVPFLFLPIFVFFVPVFVFVS